MIPFAKEFRKRNHFLPNSKEIHFSAVDAVDRTDDA